MKLTPETVDDARTQILSVILAAQMPGTENDVVFYKFLRAVNPLYEEGKLTAVVLSRLLSAPDETTRPMDWWKSTPRGERIETLETVLNELPSPSVQNDELDAVLSLEYAALRLDMPDGGPNTARWITSQRYAAGKIAYDAATAELEMMGTGTLWVDFHRWLASAERTDSATKRVLRGAARRILAGKPLAPGATDQ